MDATACSTRRRIFGRGTAISVTGAGGGGSRSRRGTITISWSEAASTSASPSGCPARPPGSDRPPRPAGRAERAARAVPRAARCRPQRSRTARGGGGSRAADYTAVAPAPPPRGCDDLRGGAPSCAEAGSRRARRTGTISTMSADPAPSWTLISVLFSSIPSHRRSRRRCTRRRSTCTGATIPLGRVAGDLVNGRIVNLRRTLQLGAITRPRVRGQARHRARWSVRYLLTRQGLELLGISREPPRGGYLN